MGHFCSIKKELEKIGASIIKGQLLPTFGVGLPNEIIYHCHCRDIGQCDSACLLDFESRGVSMTHNIENALLHEPRIIQAKLRCGREPGFGLTLKGQERKDVSLMGAQVSFR